MRQIAGPSGQMSWIRDGPKYLDDRNITEAVDSRLVPYVVAVSLQWKCVWIVLHLKLFCCVINN